MDYLPQLAIFGLGLYLFGFFSRKLYTAFREGVSSVAPQILRYWTAVIVIVLLTLSAGWWIALVSVDAELIGRWQTLLAATAIVFGFFVGFFAFAQVVESRFDKLVDKGIESLHKKTPQFSRAIWYLEEAYKIKNHDYHLLANLLEAYLLTGKTEEFDKKVYTLQKNGICIDNSEKIVKNYLLLLRSIIEGNIVKSEQQIRELIDFINTNTLKTPVYTGWSFKQLQSSYAYDNLSGERKVHLDNTVRYLEGKLSPAEKENFEKGNFALITAP